MKPEYLFLTQQERWEHLKKASEAWSQYLAGVLARVAPRIEINISTKEIQHILPPWFLNHVEEIKKELDKLREDLGLPDQTFQLQRMDGADPSTAMLQDEFIELASVNRYSDIESAKNAWQNDVMWKFSREYFKKPGEACICRRPGKGHYFIITHPDCVRYRKGIGEFVMDLNISK